MNQIRKIKHENICHQTKTSKISLVPQNRLAVVTDETGRIAGVKIYLLTKLASQMETDNWKRKEAKMKRNCKRKEAE